MSGHQRWRPIGEILVEAGAITSLDLEWGLGEQRRTGRRLGEVLIGAGLTTYLALAQAMAVQAEAAPVEPPAPPPTAAPQVAPAAPVAVAVAEAPPAQSEPPRRSAVTPELGPSQGRLEAVEGLLRDRQRAFMELVTTTETLRQRIANLEAQLAERDEEIVRIKLRHAAA